MVDFVKAFAPSYDWDRRLLFAEHHQSHAASAFFASPFHEAVVLTMDGVGEWPTTSVGFGSGNHLEMRREVHFPHSPRGPAPLSASPPWRRPRTGARIAMKGHLRGTTLRLHAVAERYSEFYFCDVQWPAFRKIDLLRAIRSYQGPH